MRKRKALKNQDLEFRKDIVRGDQLRILFLGQKECAADALKWTVAKKQKIVGVISKPGSVVEKTAVDYGLPVITVMDAEEMARSGKIDLCLSVLYWNRIKEPLISLPRLGCINFHPAILPDYKGLGGCNMAIMDGLKDWGVSAHYVDEDFDTGEIIKVFRFSIDSRNETAFSLKKKTEAMLFDLYRSILCDQIHSGMKFTETMQNEGGVYISRDRMLQMMEIHPECDDIERKVRAFWFPPHDGAYIELNGRRYTLVNHDIIQSFSW